MSVSNTGAKSNTKIVELMAQLRINSPDASKIRSDIKREIIHCRLNGIPVPEAALYYPFSVGRAEQH